MPRTRIRQVKLHLQTFREEVPVNSAECHEHCCFSIFQYYVREELSNVVVLATCRVTKIVWNAAMLFSILGRFKWAPILSYVRRLMSALHVLCRFLLFKRLSNIVDDITPII
jgi:hypothetical protein